MRSITVQVQHSGARGAALARLGFESKSHDEAGPISSIMKSARSTKVWRVDGRDMTTGDIRAVRAVLKA